MVDIPQSAGQRQLQFFRRTRCFLLEPGLPFAEVSRDDRIEAVFAKHDNLFGRTYTTAIVLWAWMSQVLRDGKEAACQSAVSCISSYLQLATRGDVDPDTRDYCRARAKLSENAIHQLASDVANGCEAAVDPSICSKAVTRSSSMGRRS